MTTQLRSAIVAALCERRILAVTDRRYKYFNGAKSFSPALERLVTVRKHLRWVMNRKLNQP